MLRLHGFTTQNTLKALYVFEEAGVEYEFKYVNLYKGEHKGEDFQKLTLVGKVPVLQIGDDSIFESGAICRYVANQAPSSLYPQDALQRAKVDQWMDFFSIHLGKWLSTLFFENVIREKAGMGQPDTAKCDEAHNFCLEQMALIDAHLTDNKYFTGDTLTIADLFAFAYIEQVRTFDFSLDAFTHVKAWFENLDTRESVVRGRKKAGL